VNNNYGIASFGIGKAGNDHYNLTSLPKEIISSGWHATRWHLSEN